MKTVRIRKKPVDNQGWKRQHRQIEKAIQKEYVKWLKENYDVEVIHIPNEGDVPPQYRKVLIAMGLRKGAPDLIILWQEMGLLFQEIKADKGKLSKDQEDLGETIKWMGFNYEVSHGLEKCKQAARKYFPLKKPI